ncbi:MAG: hypothetical protein Q4G40_04845 [Brachybacterium sp.]|nr:hypothetical protein [Brachybacterium sp.]
MAKKGMVPEQVDNAAAQIRSFGEEARSFHQEAQARVTDLDWTGDDRDQYVSRFESEVGQLIEQIAAQAADFADRAQRNAQEQRQASA